MPRKRSANESSSRLVDLSTVTAWVYDEALELGHPPARAIAEVMRPGAERPEYVTYIRGYRATIGADGETSLHRASRYGGKAFPLTDDPHELDSRAPGRLVLAALPLLHEYAIVDDRAAQLVARFEAAGFVQP